MALAVCNDVTKSDLNRLFYNVPSKTNPVDEESIFDISEAETPYLCDDFNRYNVSFGCVA